MQNLIIADELVKINKFTRKELSEDEVYCFGVILCDNEIDRDCERFSLNAISQLSKLFVGKTGIFDHNPKGSNQTARIYSTQVITDNTKTTSIGEPFTILKAMAYMVRTNANVDLIKEIDAGIKKEVSISCNARKQICSVCSNDVRKNLCDHLKGKKYNNKICHVVLDDISDAYEWSFVAVPAQINAGITKHFCANFDTHSDSDLPTKNFNSNISTDDVNSVRNFITQDIIKLSYLAYPMVEKDFITKVADNCSVSELIILKRKLEKSVNCECTPQLISSSDMDTKNNKQYKII